MHESSSVTQVALSCVCILALIVCLVDQWVLWVAKSASMHNASLCLLQQKEECEALLCLLHQQEDGDGGEEDVPPALVERVATSGKIWWMLWCSSLSGPLLRCDRTSCTCDCCC